MVLVLLVQSINCLADRNRLASTALYDLSETESPCLAAWNVGEVSQSKHRLHLYRKNYQEGP